MKIQLIFTEVNSGKEFEQTIEFEDNSLMYLLTDEAAKNIYAAEMTIQKLTNNVVFLKAIKDID